jgi:hypothetical protein
MWNQSSTSTLNMLFTLGTNPSYILPNLPIQPLTIHNKVAFFKQRSGKCHKALRYSSPSRLSTKTIPIYRMDVE